MFDCSIALDGFGGTGTVVPGTGMPAIEPRVRRTNVGDARRRSGAETLIVFAG